MICKEKIIIMMAYLEDMEEYLEYDAEKTNNFISNLQHEQHKYAVKADALYNAHDRYCNNDTFVGESAETTKRYIHLVWKKYIEDIDTLQKGIYKQYCDMADTFSKTVDSSPKARIKIPVLKKIRSDYREMYDSLEYHGKNIMRIAQDLEDKFGKYGEVTQPNYHRAMDVFDEFCGTGGFLDKCIKKMVEFDDYCSNAIDKSGLKDMADNTVDRLFNSKYALSSMTVYDPSVEQTTVNMAALQAGAIKIPWLKGHLPINHITLRTSANTLNPFKNPIYPGFYPFPLQKNKTYDNATLKLQKELKTVSDRDMNIPMKVKDCFNTDEKTLEKVFSLDAYIENASEKYGVDKAMIQAVLYREIRCYGLDDPVSDAAVIETYASKHLTEFYKSNNAKFRQIPNTPIDIVDDSSTGVGQIFAATAIDAYNLEYGTNYNKLDWKDKELFWNKLQDDQYNVEMAAMVLKLKANDCGYNINNLSDEQRKLVLAGYNGSGDAALAYGVTVHDYYESFSEYNKN